MIDAGGAKSEWPAGALIHASSWLLLRRTMWTARWWLVRGHGTDLRGERAR